MKQNCQICFSTDSWCYRKQAAGANPPSPSEAILPRSTQGAQVSGQQAGQLAGVPVGLSQDFWQDI